MGVWGNHSPTMYPDLYNAQVKGYRAVEVVDDDAWIEKEFLPNVGKRGAAVIEARGASSAASAANAAIEHVRDWVSGTTGGWVSMGVPSDGSYGIPEGLICGFPCTCEAGEYQVVEGLRDRRVLARQDRRLGRRADRRARHGRGRRDDLSGYPATRGPLPTRRAPFARRMCGPAAARLAAWSASAPRVPAPIFLLDLFFRLQTRQHAVQVVLLDSHLRGQLGDRDPGLTLHERQRLGSTCAAAFAPAGTPFGRAGPVCARRSLSVWRRSFRFPAGRRFAGGGSGGGGGGVARFFAGPRAARASRSAPAAWSRPSGLRGRRSDDAGQGADAASSRRWNSSTNGFSSFSRSLISRRLSSRKSVTSKFLFTRGVQITHGSDDR